MGGALALAGSLAGAALLGPDHVAWRAGCVLAYPVIAYVSGIIRREDLDAIRGGTGRGGGAPAN